MLTYLASLKAFRIRWDSRFVDLVLCRMKVDYI